MQLQISPVTGMIRPGRMKGKILGGTFQEGGGEKNWGQFDIFNVMAKTKISFQFIHSMPSLFVK